MEAMRGPDAAWSQPSQASVTGSPVAEPLPAGWRCPGRDGGLWAAGLRAAVPLRLPRITARLLPRRSGQPGAGGSVDVQRGRETG